MAGRKLRVDTLFDEVLAKEKLGTMEAATGVGGDKITTLVNTHANGDHVFGNRVVQRREMIASAARPRQMAEGSPCTRSSL